MKHLLYIFIVILYHNAIYAQNSDCHHNGHKYVDLGLSVKWADYNIGANTAEETGYFFSWGEIMQKNLYEYSVLDKVNIHDISRNLKYDAATAIWGGNWRLPTKREVEELINQCKWFWCTINGIAGVNITGPNGNNIFLPLAGFKKGEKWWHNGLVGVYWTSSQSDEIVLGHRFSYALRINAIIKEDCQLQCGPEPRGGGFCIRAVLP